MAEEGRKVSGSATIPVKDMAMTMLDKMFPHLTPAQIDSLKTGSPMPPSPGMLITSDDTRTPEQKAADTRLKFDGSLFGQIVSKLESPLVSCVLVFGRAEAGTVKLARKAVNQFVAQSYPHKQLIIVNGTDTKVTNTAHRAIKEVQVRDCPTVADLRNHGMSLADGEWVKPCWDDDDWYDPHLLTYMMLHRQPDKAVMLTNQMRIAVWKGTVFMLEDKDGIPNTMIVPNNSKTRFSDVDDEDLLFVNEHYGVRRVIVPNREFPANCLSVATYHERNKTPIEQFMREFAAPEAEGRWAVGEEETHYAKDVLTAFGFKVEAKPVEEKKGELVLKS